MSKEFENLLGQYWDLAYLEGKSGVSQGDKANEVLHALKNLAEQPAQQEQEPVGVFREDDDVGHVELYPHQQMKLKDGDKLYTSPPAQRTWVGLTLEDMETTHWSPDFRAGAKWAAAKLKEKNTGLGGCTSSALLTQLCMRGRFGRNGNEHTT